MTVPLSCGVAAPFNYEAMLQFACGIIVWEHAALLG
jgi:hypothetical protein